MHTSCIIIEDEPLALERTRDYVQKLPFLDLLGAFDNALAFLHTNAVDLVFRDIHMDELSGTRSICIASSVFCGSFFIGSHSATNLWLF